MMVSSCTPRLLEDGGDRDSGDRAKILESYRSGVVIAADSRPSFPSSSMLQLNCGTLTAGQVLFFPISMSVGVHQLPFLSLALSTTNVDDKTARRRGSSGWTMLSEGPRCHSMLELLVFNVCVASGHYMAQKHYLARARWTGVAMSGAWYLSLILLGALR
jgi:hypothetical protein